MRSLQYLIISLNDFWSVIVTLTTLMMGNMLLLLFFLNSFLNRFSKSLYKYHNFLILLAMTFWNVNKIEHWFYIITMLIILVILIISVHFTSNIGQYCISPIAGERYKHIIFSFHYCCLLYIITPTRSTLQLPLQLSYCTAVPFDC